MPSENKMSLKVKIVIDIIFSIFGVKYPSFFTGFGLLEAGMVSSKNEVNIMVKNAADVIFGGLSYWAFGYALTFGNSAASNPFCGIGYFFVNTNDINKMGLLYSNFIFQVSNVGDIIISVFADN